MDKRRKLFTEKKYNEMNCNNPLASAAECMEDDAPPIEGEPRLPIRKFSFTNGLHIFVRAYTHLPPSDALALLEDRDETGMMVWDGSLHLARFLCENPGAWMTHSDSFCVIELGAGSGICGLVSAKLLSTSIFPSIVFLTDGNPECVALASDNIHRNQINETPAGGGRQLVVEAALLSWANQQHVDEIQTRCDRCAFTRIVLLSADVIHCDVSVRPLILAAQQIYETLIKKASGVLEMVWLIGFLPRSWTLTQGAEHFEMLLAAIRELSWSIEVVWRLRQPSHQDQPSPSFNDDSRAIRSTDFNGCILRVIARGSSSAISS